MKRNLLLALALILMLTSCAQAPTATLTPAPTPTPEPTPVPTPSIEVQMPWDAPDTPFSPIPAGEEPRYYYDKPLGIFVPSADYGAVYPYLGVYHFDMWGPSYLYGLCTADGRIITAPIYSAPEILGSGDNKAYLFYTGSVQEKTKDGWYETVATSGVLVGLDGSWTESFDNAQRFIVPTIEYSKTLNYPVLAAQRNGLWGGIAMDGTIAVPFEHKQYFRMYEGEALYRGDYSQRQEYQIIRYNRMIAHERNDHGELNWDKSQLLDENLNPLASFDSSYFGSSNDFLLQMNMADEFALKTYDFDGNFLGQLAFQDTESWETGIALFGDYVMIPSVDGKSLSFYDRCFNLLSTMESDMVWSFWGFERTMTICPVAGVYHTSDPETNLHRTYLPDGTLLTTTFLIIENIWG